MTQFSKEELRKLRNEIAVRWVIETLLQLPHKEVEGVFRFLCPACGEFQTAVNPKTNLSRCFRCQMNFNTIELVMHGCPLHPRERQIRRQQGSLCGQWDDSDRTAHRRRIRRSASDRDRCTERRRDRGQGRCRRRPRLHVRDGPGCVESK